MRDALVNNNNLPTFKARRHLRDREIGNLLRIGVVLPRMEIETGIIRSSLRFIGEREWRTDIQEGLTDRSTDARM